MENLYLIIEYFITVPKNPGAKEYITAAAHNKANKKVCINRLFSDIVFYLDRRKHRTCNEMKCDHNLGADHIPHRRILLPSTELRHASTVGCIFGHPA